MKILAMLGSILVLLVVVQGDPATRPALVDWNEKIAAEKLATIESPPFVLVGDGGAERLKHYQDHTVLAAADALWAMYFEEKPSEPIIIFLFESEGRYKRLSRDWFGQPNPPHYGYCRRDGVMVMNIGTGTGTLVHELTHALIKYDFPNVPTWFNEGLASLYEQCQIDGKQMKGLKNWRLPALKKAIEENRLRPLRAMIEDQDFYNDERSGLNYAQARYLMMYLQEKGVLKEFYRAFRDGAADDPAGVRVLERITSAKLEELDREIREWIRVL